MTVTHNDLTDLAACYWCAHPIDHQPGTAVVGLHWIRRPREIIEPVADDDIAPRQQRRFEWGLVTEYAHAHARCAEEAAGARHGQLSDRYEYPWGEPEPEPDDPTIDELAAVLDEIDADLDDEWRTDDQTTVEQEDAPGWGGAHGPAPAEHQDLGAAPGRSDSSPDQEDEER